MTNEKTEPERYQSKLSELADIVGYWGVRFLFLGALTYGCLYMVKCGGNDIRDDEIQRRTLDLVESQDYQSYLQQRADLAKQIIERSPDTNLKDLTDYLDRMLPLTNQPEEARKYEK